MTPGARPGSCRRCRTACLIQGLPGPPDPWLPALLASPNLTDDETCICGLRWKEELLADSPAPRTAAAVRERAPPAGSTCVGVAAVLSLNPHLLRGHRTSPGSPFFLADQLSFQRPQVLWPKTERCDFPPVLWPGAQAGSPDACGQTQLPWKVPCLLAWPWGRGRLFRIALPGHPPQAP